ncbi:phosphate acyltransferase PlsX [Helicovermis profundi]|uniref:Phosphate acyltransferase n=1 Tax=Helicovermis profundi TaxID=3065157 RepID=A0AAU9EBV0_9FIRM|nr:phosphate acyltransferase PlsX [Clostridia bacterium S502]
MKIAIDVMGGDLAPIETVKGAIEALEFTSSQIVLIGDKGKIEIELKKYKFEKSRIEIIHTSEVILNEDKPVKAIKSKKDSSMVVGMKMLKDGEIEGFVSAGNTGALLAGGLLKVGRIKGIDRPALCSIYPTSKGACVLTDAGANADCKPRNLFEFAHMASIYADKVFEIENPKVGLVNIGAEEGKGNALVKESYDLLKESELNFIGNLEARNIPNATADVIVCDGFTGNVILKLSEGVAKSFIDMLKKSFLKNIGTKLAALLVKNSLKDMKKMLDYTEYGGAPLLGCNGLIMKAHGSSNSKAFMNALKYTEKCALTNVVSEITKVLEK